MNMKIESADDYQKKEDRLREITSTLEVISKNEDVNLAEVIALRDEARVLAVNLKDFIKTTFEKQQ